MHVSVIIPAYNAEETIKETIHSVLAQTYQNLELIVVNDGSTDNTLEMLQKIDDKRLKIHSIENRGLPAARNFGLSVAIGKYISFIDADDLWIADKLDKQLRALEREPDAGIAYSWTVLIDSEGRFVGASDRLYLKGSVFKEMLLGCFLYSGSNALFRKDCIKSVGLFDQDKRSAADWDFLIRCSAAWNFVVVPNYQVFYRVRKDSMSSRIDEVEKDLLMVTEEAFRNAPVEYQPLKNKSLSLAYQYITSLYLTRRPEGDWKEQARVKLEKSLRIWPPIFWTSIALYNLITLMFLHLPPYSLSSRMLTILQEFKRGLMISFIPELSELYAINRKSPYAKVTL